MFAASSALTVKLNVTRVWAFAAPLIEKCVTALLTTLIALVVPFNEAVTVSAAVMVCEPIVFSVAKKVPVPPVSFESGGNVACASLLVKCTVPA